MPRFGEVVSIEKGEESELPQPSEPDQVGSPVQLPTRPSPLPMPAARGLTMLQLANRLARALESAKPEELSRVVSGPITRAGTVLDPAEWMAQLRGFELVDLVDAGPRAVARGSAGGRDVVLFLTTAGESLSGVEQVGG